MKILTRKKSPEDRHRRGGQAMVEFALVFPILILLILGILEAGRLLFIYGSVVTASREAARYGSTAGLIESGSDYFRYQDCEGIRESAKRVAFLFELDDDEVGEDSDGNDILIQYDSGSGTPLIDKCPPGVDVDDTIDVSPEADGTSKRIVVTVFYDYEPMVPIVPLDPFRIDSVSARTFLGIIEYYPE